MPETDDFLTVAEVASILKLNQQTVRNWIDDGKLPVVHVGRRIRIRRAAFAALVERGSDRPTARTMGAVASIWDGETIPPPQVPTEG